MTPIRFDMEDLSDEDMAVLVAEASTTRRVNVFHKGTILTLPDFGTFLVGCVPSDLDMEIAPFILNDTDMVFVVPRSWDLSHICKRLAMFPSTTQARKNGKSTLPSGFSQHQVKVNHVKGVITVFRC